MGYGHQAAVNRYNTHIYIEIVEHVKIEKGIAEVESEHPEAKVSQEHYKVFVPKKVEVS